MKLNSYMASLAKKGEKKKQIKKWKFTIAFIAVDSNFSPGEFGSQNGHLTWWVDHLICLVLRTARLERVSTDHGLNVVLQTVRDVQSVVIIVTDYRETLGLKHLQQIQ